jgi:hypothetical protein
MTEALREASERLVRVRRASLRAVARVHGAPEPTERECDGANWEVGLSGAYRSLPGRGVALVDPAPAVAQLPALAAPRYRAPWGWALGAGAAAFALALATAPAAALWETRGHLPLQGRLGVPGAPDSLLFAALARAWAVALSPFVSSDVALTVFLLASLAALAVAGFLLVQAALGFALGARGWASAGAFVTVLAGAGLVAAEGWVTSSRSSWMLSSAAASAAVWLGLLWFESRGLARSDRYLLAGSYFALLALSGVTAWLLPIGFVLLFVVATLASIGRSGNRGFLSY